MDEEASNMQQTLPQGLNQLQQVTHELVVSGVGEDRDGVFPHLVVCEEGREKLQR